jgi:hypothetical protein
VAKSVEDQVPASVPEYETDDEYEYQPRKSRSGWYGLAVLIVLLVLLAAIPSSRAFFSGSSSSSASNSGYSAQSGVTAYGQPLTLSLSSFTDPASDSSSYTSDANSNDHFAVVNVAVTNNGNSTLPATIPVTIAAFGSDGQVYQKVTETDDGNTLCSYGNATSLSPSETLTYCAGYVLPENVTVTRVEVSGNQGYGSGTVSWNVPDTFRGWSN